MDRLLAAIIGTLVIGGIIRFALIDVNVKINLPSLSSPSSSLNSPQPSPPSSFFQQQQPRMLPASRCAAIVMANTGVWGASQGNTPCAERLEHARAACERSSPNCGNFATSMSWVAGVYCFRRWGNGWQRNQYAGAGYSEEEAFQKALFAIDIAV